MEKTENTSVPCRYCGTPTPMLGTKLCDPCWNLKTAMTANLKNVDKILKDVKAEIGNEVKTQMKKKLQKPVYETIAVRIPEGYRLIGENTTVLSGDLFLVPELWKPCRMSVGLKVGSLMTAIRRTKK